MSSLLGDFIAYHAAVRPTATACIDLRAGEAFDYQAFNQLVDRCAGWLVATVAEPTGQRIATLTRNSAEAVALHYACARTGAIYVPLNWRLSGHELSALVADAAPRLLLYEAEFSAQALEAGEGQDNLQLVLIDPSLRARIQSSETVPSTPPDPNAPWTLLYTSGTTGRPKGVVITHHAALWGSMNLAMIAGIGPGSVMLCDPPLFHTVGLFGICRTALLTGATVVLSDRFLPGATLDRLSDPALSVTHYFGVPQIGQMLINDPGFEAADLSRLKAILMGGAPLPPSVVERFADRGVPVANGYGITETCSLMHMPLDLARIRAKPSHVGTPSPFIEVRIVGPDGSDAPEGEAGEIWLRGPTVTPGYWNQPAATAAAFAGDWYRTGDAGRRDPDGLYEIVGRLKDMYISGGENVYPAEVEAVITGLDGVLEAGVVGVPDARWGERGYAFIVAAEDAGVTEGAVLELCAKRLASYKRPAAICFVPALPRTASGKILKSDLLQMALRYKEENEI